MRPFHWQAPAGIRFGRGEAAGLARSIAPWGTRVLVVHGRSTARAQWALDDLHSNGCATEALSCADEPDLEMLHVALLRARAFDASCVVGIGGGSVIDLAKAIAALAPAKTDPLDHLEVVGKGLPLPVDPLPFAAVPTTAGTGSEATKNAVIGVPEHGRKVSLRDPRMLANLAIVDPALTDNTPRSVTLASGLDAITQVIEPYLCTRANAMTDAFCCSAIPTGLKAIVRLMDAEDADARDAMAWTSLSGGLALANSGLGAVHGLAGVIGGRTGAAHGAVCGALLPHVLEANGSRVAPETVSSARFDQVYHWIAEALDCNAEEAPQALARWSAAHGLPRLGDLGLLSRDIPSIAEASHASSSMKANPTDLGTADLADILHRAV